MQETPIFEIQDEAGMQMKGVALISFAIGLGIGFFYTAFKK
jgi:hypothetical protein